MKMYMIRYDQNMFLYFKEPNLGKVTRIDETGWFGKYWPLQSVDINPL